MHAPTAHPTTATATATQRAVDGVQQLLRFLAVLPAAILVSFLATACLDWMAASEFGEQAMEALAGTLLGNLWAGVKAALTAGAVVIAGAHVAPRLRTSIAILLAVLNFGVHAWMFWWLLPGIAEEGLLTAGITIYAICSLVGDCVGGVVGVQHTFSENRTGPARP